MTGQGFSSQKAQSMGLITEVVEPQELDATVEKYVRRFLVAGPKAMVEAKALVREVTLREREDALRFAVSKIAELRSSEEGQEGRRRQGASRRGRGDDTGTAQGAGGAAARGARQGERGAQLLPGT